MVPEPLRLESVIVILIDLATGPLSTVKSIPTSELCANVGCLSELCAILEIPVVLARAPLQAQAETVLPEVTQHLRHPQEIAHETNDSWETPAFVEAVQASGRKQLVFAGIATDVGVALTALSALRAGYQVAVLSDVCGTISARAEQAAIYRLNQAGATITTWSSFAGEIQRNYTRGKGPQLLRIVARSLSVEQP
jgi:hypothetical protein